MLIPTLYIATFILSVLFSFCYCLFTNVTEGKLRREQLRKSYDQPADNALRASKS